MTKKILIADDEPGIRELVRRVLSKDYVVVEAQNGVEAVNITHSQKPDLILLDIMMPEMDGLTACNTIKKDRRACPVDLRCDVALHPPCVLRQGQLMPTSADL